MADAPKPAAPPRLVIRPEQVAAFDVLARRRFVERTAAWVRAERPRAVARLDDEALSRSVEAAIARARSEHGFEVELDLAVFALLEVTVGRSFDRDPEVRALMGEAGRRKPGRMREVLDALPPARWRELARGA